MTKIVKQTQVMEPDTIEKNGARQKNWADKKNFLLFAFLAIAIGFFMLNSCKQEQENSLEVSPTSLQFDAGASDYQTVNITSNVSTWDAIVSASWCHLENASTTDFSEYKLGSGNGMIRIRVDANTTVYSRSFTIEVRDENNQSLSRNITVLQAAGTGTGGNTGGGGAGTIPAAPTGVTASEWVDSNGDYSWILWGAVPAADSYNIYWSNTMSGSYSLIANAPNYSVSAGTQLNYKHYSTFMDNYYKLTSKNSAGESGYSNVVYCKNSKGTGSGGGGGSIPAAPTGVTAVQNGSSINLTWNSVPNAASYNVYWGRTSAGSTNWLGNPSANSYIDNGALSGDNYYWVTAINNAGESAKSSYAYCSYGSGGGTGGGGTGGGTTSYAPCLVTYGNCTVSGTTITMRWTVSTASGCGTPTRAILRVKNPGNDTYVSLQTLSGTATSVSFNYTPYICTETYSKGYVYVGIILENDNGSSGGIPKVYDTVSKTWIL